MVSYLSFSKYVSDQRVEKENKKETGKKKQSLFLSGEEMKYFTWDKIRPITDTASFNNRENWIYCHLSGGCNHSLRLTDRKPLSFAPLLFIFLSISFILFSSLPSSLSLSVSLSLWRVACQSYSTNITFSFPMHSAIVQLDRIALCSSDVFFIFLCSCFFFWRVCHLASITVANKYSAYPHRVLSQQKTQRKCSHRTDDCAISRRRLQGKGMVEK